MDSKKWLEYLLQIPEQELIDTHAACSIVEVWKKARGYKKWPLLEHALEHGGSLHGIGCNVEYMRVVYWSKVKSGEGMRKEKSLMKEIYLDFYRSGRTRYRTSFFFSKS